MRNKRAKELLIVILLISSPAYAYPNNTYFLIERENGRTCWVKFSQEEKEKMSPEEHKRYHLLEMLFGSKSIEEYNPKDTRLFIKELLPRFYKENNFYPPKYKETKGDKREQKR